MWQNKPHMWKNLLIFFFCILIIYIFHFWRCSTKGAAQLNKIVKHEHAIKPIGMFFCVCDGRPDEYPRFPKTLDVAKQHFKKYNLDALLISTIVPGLSAYNQAEIERNGSIEWNSVQNFASTWKVWNTFKFVKKNYWHKPRKTYLQSSW